MLERLSALPDRLCCYEIDVQLKRYASAVSSVFPSSQQPFFLSGSCLPLLLFNCPSRTLEKPADACFLHTDTSKHSTLSLSKHTHQRQPDARLAGQARGGSGSGGVGASVDAC
eukprot:3522326-Rhodomonas_salina.1